MHFFQLFDGLVMRISFLCIVSIIASGLISIHATCAETPVVFDSSLSIELVASEPDLVTPVSCRFDQRGRLFVVESHTHFPPDDYDGPKADRIKIFDDTDGDGKLDRTRTFHEGTEHPLVKTMGLAVASDGSLVISTRASIIRITDLDGDDVADEFTTIVTLDTKADYPHNGLSGLLLEGTDDDAILTFGMGENFGEPYTLTAQDGSRQTGGGEGGNLFRCGINGTHLQRIATGFWNPFGLCRDEAGRLLMVDNDADAMPPCRIVNVQPGGDYGFQFRFGRAGTHPLQAWNGELPGTLGMVAGTGEAPCAIMSYRNQYWVTSWGDNRIERYTPTMVNGKLSATRDVAVLGDSMFRPVDMAIAPDGSMYVTDWVDRSYNVHRTGRLWRIQFSKPSSGHPAIQRFDGERERETAMQSATDDVSELMRARWATITAPMSKDAIAVRHQTILDALDSPDEDVCLAAVRWAAETGEEDFIKPIANQWNRDALSTPMVGAIAAAVSYLESGKVEAGGFDSLTRASLVSIATDVSRSADVRRSAMVLVPPDAAQWSIDDLVAMVSERQSSIRREAARHLIVLASSNPAAREEIDQLFSAGNLNEDVKVDLMTAKQATRPATDKVIPVTARPDRSDLATWLSLVGEGGDVDNGWRVFFGGQAKCASCHAVDGRGAGVGPDLTGLAGNRDRSRILDSILHPSREIGPMYTTWNVITEDGRLIAGIKLNGGGVGQSSRYLLADATTIDVPLNEIETQRTSDTSIMPEGLEQLISIDELRDLLAFLSTRARD